MNDNTTALLDATGDGLLARWLIDFGEPKPEIDLRPDVAALLARYERDNDPRVSHGLPLWHRFRDALRVLCGDYSDAPDWPALEAGLEAYSRRIGL